MAIRESASDKVFGIINLALVTVLFLIVLYPLLYVISCSVSSPELVGTGKVVLIPHGLNLEGYKRVFREENIIIGYKNTFIYTILGTLFNLFLTLPCAYSLSKKALPCRGILMVFFLITMYFNGGMIPTFLLVKSLGLYNTRAVLIILGGVSIYNVIICRTFFAGLPQELEESAYIEGCSATKTFIWIILPLSKALVGVMVLYYGVAHWNSYFTALIYVAREEYKPLQLFLRRILITESMNATMNEMDDEMKIQAEYLKHLIKYSVIIVASLPVLVIYPFLQKYFDKGILVGSLKG